MGSILGQPALGGAKDATLELANLAAFLFSPMATYLNGECVVIDGGEWLKAQGFASFTDLPREQVKAQMEAMRPKNG